MSSMLLASGIFAVAAVAGPPAITAEEALARAKAAYSLEQERRREPCPEGAPGEIVVCRQLEDPDKLRVPHEVDPEGDVIRAPDVSGLPPCTGACVRFGSVPEYPPMIDLKGLPEAPEGSDADRLYGALDEGGEAEASPAPQP